MKRKATIHTPLAGPMRCVNTNVRARPSSDLLSRDRAGINQSTTINAVENMTLRLGAAEFG